MKILAVDDSYFIRQYLKKCLLSIDSTIEFTLAASGEEGYEQFLAFQPDVVFTDLLMPGMGGEELVRKIRQTDSGVKIVVLTADIQKLVREELETLHITAFLNKPITKESISGVLEGILRKELQHAD